MNSTIIIYCSLTIKEQKDCYEEIVYITDIEKNKIINDITEELYRYLDVCNNLCLNYIPACLLFNTDFNKFEIQLEEKTEEYRDELLECLEFLGYNCQEPLKINNRYLTWEFRIVNTEILNSDTSDSKESIDSGYLTPLG